MQKGEFNSMRSISLIYNIKPSVLLHEPSTSRIKNKAGRIARHMVGFRNLGIACMIKRIKKQGWAHCSPYDGFQKLRYCMYDQK